MSNDLVYDRIIINEDLKALIPPLASVELEQLEENILKEGVRDPLIIWPKNDSFILIDGHNRYSVCQKHGLKFPFKKVEFANEDEAKDWMIRNQLGRRNLTHEQQSYLRGARSLLLKSQNNELKSQEVEEMVAKENDVSSKTVRRDEAYKKGIDVIEKKDPAEKQKVLKGESHIKKAKIESLAKHPERIDAILAPEPEKKEVLIRKLSAEEVAQIAFEYILKESRPPKSFYHDLGKDPNNIDQLEFFRDWDNHQKEASSKTDH